MTDKPPAIDQDGKMINPHNPDFITKVPWYLGNNAGPTLKHHNIQKIDHEITLTEADEIVNRKLAAQQEARSSAPKTMYRKGACKNCGAMTHKDKDCLERPRSVKKMAFKSGLDIAPDEVVVRLEDYGKVSYAAKRDMYRGYDPTEYKEIISRHEKLEEERKQRLLEEKEAKKRARQEQKALQREKPEADEEGASGVIIESDSDDESVGAASETAGEGVDVDEDYKARDDQLGDFQDTHAPQGGLGGAGMRVTVRNLRIREDTPKYLRNLDLDSAFYDPKSRSMRANPYPHLSPDEVPYAGDNFIRYTGDAVKLAQNQILCWEMQARGEQMDVLSNPSQAEFLQKVISQKKSEVKSAQAQMLKEKYGVSEQKVLDPRLRLGQTEAYVEYDKHGRVVHSNVGLGAGSAPAAGKVRTKYEEDVYTNNHTSVWGSYYNRFSSAWGYACCHSSLRNSYCTGSKGREANDAAYVAQVKSEVSRGLNAAANTSTSTSTSTSNGNNSSNAAGAGMSTKAEHSSRSDLYGTGNRAVQLDDKKLQAALQGDANGLGKRWAGEVSAEDMEAYRMKRSRGEDPMANYVDEG